MTTETTYTFGIEDATPAKLYYFNIAGKAEAIRCALYHAKIPFTDVRLTREDFYAKKSSGELPYGQVPALVVDGTMLAQSSAIMRAVGRMSNSSLYPTDVMEAAQIDSIIDSEKDLFMGIDVSKYSSRFGFSVLDEKPELRKDVRKILNDSIVPRHLQNLERTIDLSVGPWLGKRVEPSIADFIIAPRLKQLMGGSTDGITKEVFKSTPKLVSMVDAFYALPSVTEFLDKSTS